MFARFALFASILFVASCSNEVIRYAPIPVDAIPPAPKYESVKSDELMCLTDSAYERLARNFLACKRYGAEMRALVGGE